MAPEPKTAGSISASATSRKRPAASARSSAKSAAPKKSPTAKRASSRAASTISSKASGSGTTSGPKTSDLEASGAGKTAVRGAGPRKSGGKPKASQPGPELATRRPGGKAVAAEPWGAREIGEAFRRLRAANPEPRGELAYVNPFTLLVAVVLSAQATDAGVNKATPALFAAADTPEKMVALGEDRVREMIRTIGLFRTKAKNVVALSERLVAEHGGMVPPIRAELEKLPGVGRKTANVVLNNAFGEETIAVDTHVFRVGNRTGLAPGRTPLEVETALESRVPAAYRRHAHHWLILHGRYVCKAQRPACEKCPIADLCRWPQKAVFMAGKA